MITGSYQLYNTIRRYGFSSKQLILVMLISSNLSFLTVDRSKDNLL